MDRNILEGIESIILQYLVYPQRIIWDKNWSVKKAITLMAAKIFKFGVPSAIIKVKVFARILQRI